MAVAKRREGAQIVAPTEKTPYEKNLEQITAEHKGKYRTVQGGGANKGETKTIPEVNKKGRERLARKVTVSQNAPHVKTPHRAQDYMADKGHNIPSDESLDKLYEQYGERKMIPITYKGKVAKPNSKGETPVITKEWVHGKAVKTQPKQKTENKTITTYVSDIVPSVNKITDLNNKAIEKQAPKVGHVHEVSNEQKKKIAETVNNAANLKERESPKTLTLRNYSGTKKDTLVIKGKEKDANKATVRQTKKGIYVNKRGAMYHKVLQQADIKNGDKEEERQQIYSPRGATSKIIKNSEGWYSGDTTAEKIQKETLDTINGKKISAGQILHSKQQRKADINKNKKEERIRVNAGERNIKINDANSEFNKAEIEKAKQEGRKPELRTVKAGGKSDQATKNWTKMLATHGTTAQEKLNAKAQLWNRAVEKKATNPSLNTLHKNYKNIGNTVRASESKAGTLAKEQSVWNDGYAKWSYASPKMAETVANINHTDRIYAKSRATHYKNIEGIDEKGNYKKPTQPKPNGWDEEKGKPLKNYYERHNVYVDATGMHRKGKVTTAPVTTKPKKARSGAEKLMNTISDEDVLGMFGGGKNGKK